MAPGTFLQFGDTAQFAAELLVGAFALYAAGRYVVYRKEFGGTVEHAALTALLGTVVWALLAGVPVVGVGLALLGWFAVVKYRYPGALVRTAMHAAVAWGVAAVLVRGFALVGVRLSAAGVPGV